MHSCHIDHFNLAFGVCASQALDNVCFMRAQMAAFHDQFATNQPALWAALMIFMVDMLVVLVLIGVRSQVPNLTLRPTLPNDHLRPTNLVFCRLLCSFT